MRVVAPETDPAVGEGASRRVAADVAAAVDATVAGPVLVVGSPPPAGRDLDLLARPKEYEAICSWLHGAGFLPWRHTWARFDGHRPYAVELSSTQRWQTRRHDASCLFTGSEPVPGFRHLVTPGPATVLLLASRGTVVRRGQITEKVRRRVSDALERDPGAWLAAEGGARDLGMVGALHLLRKAYERSSPLPPRERAAGLSGVLLREGPLTAKARVFLAARPKRVRPAIVSFSGLDGSGKSTQVSQLQDHLRELGVSSDRQWAGFKYANKLRGALPVLDRPSRLARETTATERDRVVPTALQGRPLALQAWAYAVVGVNAMHLWRLALRRRQGTTVLIFDRFAPDTAVKLDLHFLRTRGIDTRRQRRFFRLISPKPDVGFFVDTPVRIAYDRRREQTVEELTTMAELYQEQVEPFRLRRLDGTEPPEVLAKRVAVEVWRGLQ